MTDKKQAKSTGTRPQQREPITLAPLDFEDALSSLLQTGPHPKEPKATQGQKEAPLPKKRRKSADNPTDCD